MTRPKSLSAITLFAALALLSLGCSGSRAYRSWESPSPTDRIYGAKRNIQQLFDEMSKMPDNASTGRLFAKLDWMEAVIHNIDAIIGYMEELPKISLDRINDEERAISNYINRMEIITTKFMKYDDFRQAIENQGERIEKMERRMEEIVYRLAYLRERTERREVKDLKDAVARLKEKRNDAAIDWEVEKLIKELGDRDVEWLAETLDEMDSREIVANIGDLKNALGILNGLRVPQRASAYEAGERALELMNNGDYENAVKLYTYMIERPDPRTCVSCAYHNRGYSHAEIGEIDKAEEDYGMAIKLGAPNVHVAASSYNNRAILTAYYRNDFEKAIEEANRAVRLERYDENKLATRALMLVFADRHEAAAEDFQKIIRLSGRAIKKALNEDIKFFSQMISFDSSKADGYAYRGVVHILLENYDKAAADIDAALRLSPDHAIATRYREYAVEKKKILNIDMGMEEE